MIKLFNVFEFAWNQKGDMQLHRNVEVRLAAKGVLYDHEKVHASWNVFLSNFRCGHKKSFVSNDSNFQCKMNNEAAVAQLFLRQGFGDSNHHVTELESFFINCYSICVGSRLFYYPKCCTH